MLLKEQTGIITHFANPQCRTSSWHFRWFIKSVLVFSCTALPPRLSPFVMRKQMVLIDSTWRNFETGESYGIQDTNSS